MLLDRAAKRLLERFRLTVRPQVTGMGQGGHRSRMRAAGLEFADHRMYVPGDDIRHIDWKAFARHRQLLLKTFEEERDVYIYVLLDISTSMTRGSPPKLDVGKSLAAAFSYLGMKQFDRVRLIPFGGDLGIERTPGRSKVGYPQVERALTRLEPGGVTAFSDTTRSFAERYPRHGLVVVITDLMEAMDWGESLKVLARLGHELWVVRVTCDEDSKPDFRGELELHDVETSQDVRIRLNKKLLEAYRSEIEEHVARCQDACLGVGGRFVEAAVERPFEELLRDVITRTARSA